MDNQTKTQEVRKALRQKQARQQRILRTAAILLAIVLSLLALIQSCSTKKAIEDLAAQLAAKKAAQAQAALEAQQEAERNHVEIAPAAVAGDHSVTLTFTGDVTLASPQGADYADTFESYLELWGDNYFFENVKSIFEGDDLTVANLECSLATSVNRVEKPLAFQGKPSYISMLKDAGIDAVNTANDHAHDFGDEGHVDTLANLDNAGVNRFGNEYTKVVTVDGVAIGLVGIDETDLGFSGSKKALEKAMQQVKEKGAQLIVVSFHWGEENATKPDKEQISLAHTAIDWGAHLVIGHNPRVLQGVELYQGKYICYSLGSFLYGGSNTLEDRDNAMFQQTFTLKGDDIILGDCYIIPCVASGSEEKNDYRPDLARAELGEAIMEKIYTRSAELEGGITPEK